MKDYQKKFIELAIEHDALLFGDFTLKSGRKSPYFFNIGKLINSKGLFELGQCYAQAIVDAKVPFDGLFGPAYKGIPLASVTSAALFQLYQTNCHCAFDRKEEKDHGEGGMIMGHLGQHPLIIDDVITKGTAVRYALELIAAHNSQPAGIVVALDRQEKGQTLLSAIQEVQEAFKIPVVSMITFHDIQKYIQGHTHFGHFSDQLAQYRETYGCIS